MSIIALVFLSPALVPVEVSAHGSLLGKPQLPFYLSSLGSSSLSCVLPCLTDARRVVGSSARPAFDLLVRLHVATSKLLTCKVETGACFFFAPSFYGNAALMAAA